MNAPRGETARGYAEQPGMLGAAVDPVTEHRRAFGKALEEAVDTYAPGRASADWQQWPGLPEDAEHRSAVPGLVRIGTVAEGRLPVLVPALEIPLVIGNPELARVITPQPVNHLPYTQQRSAAKEAERNADAANVRRLQIIAKEEMFAARIARNLMVRTAAAMDPGSVAFTIYDPRGRGAAFRGLEQMEQQRLLHFVGRGQLPRLLDVLEREIIRMKAGALGKFGSFRELAGAGEPLPRPWRLVTILGGGQELNGVDQHRLARILDHGPACGVLLITHGIEIPGKRATGRNRVQWDPTEKRWHTRVNGGLRFDLDPPAPVAAAREAAAIACSTSAEAGKLPPTAEHGLTPGQHYYITVQRHLGELTAARQAQQLLQRTARFLQPEHAADITQRLPRYLALANEAAAVPQLAAAEVRSAFDGNDPIRRLEAWALFGLVQHAPDARALRWAGLRYRPAAQKTVEYYLPQVAKLVAVTQHHGQNQIPRLMRRYAAPTLPEEPPAWAFQLVAAAALRPTDPNEPATHTARSALALHLQHTHNLDEPLLNEHGEFTDPAFVGALVECEMFFLYDFQNASPELQTILARRARQRLEHIKRERLPEGLREYYDAYMVHLQGMREAERAAERLQAAAQRLTSLLSHHHTDDTGTD